MYFGVWKQSDIYSVPNESDVFTNSCNSLAFQIKYAQMFKPHRLLQGSKVVLQKN